MIDWVYRYTFIVQMLNPRKKHLGSNAKSNHRVLN